MAPFIEILPSSHVSGKADVSLGSGNVWWISSLFISLFYILYTKQLIHLESNHQLNQSQVDRVDEEREGQKKKGIER